MLEPRMDDLMTYINNLMLNTGINPFRYDAETGSRVLSGEEEAVFDWISINYLLGNFAGTCTVVHSTFKLQWLNGLKRHLFDKVYYVE